MHIDAHQHFWQYDPVRDGWITNEMEVLRRSFLPEDLQPVLMENNMDGCVVVQSDQSEVENEFQLRNAGHYDFIKGVVGWVDLRSEQIAERLSFYSGFSKLKGFRHILQSEEDRGMMLTPAFCHGIGLLRQFGFTYDLLIYPDQLGFACDLAQAFPDQSFVLDHIAKPNIKDKEMDGWKEGLVTLAAQENVHCKLSGLVTEANWRRWTKADFAPYLDVVTEAFGTKRLLYGSDWPVCLLAGAYEEVKDIVDSYYASFSVAERGRIFGQNAIDFYHL